MRHRKRGRKLSRTAAHRLALRRNMAKALLEHERIITSPAKAKEVRPFVERLITLAKRALPYQAASGGADRARYLHYYRLALSKLQDKKLVRKLFGEGEWREQESLAQRYAERPGGFTRIVRLSGSRLGVPIGGTLGEIPELSYQIAGRNRTLRLTGNQLGDNSPRVIFELVEKEMPGTEDEVAPKISVSELSEEDPAEQDEDASIEAPTGGSEAQEDDKA
jgi:large subunit ribosomal protein L17